MFYENEEIKNESETLLMGKKRKSHLTYEIYNEKEYDNEYSKPNYKTTNKKQNKKKYNLLYDEDDYWN